MNPHNNKIFKNILFARQSQWILSTIPRSLYAIRIFDCIKFPNLRDSLYGAKYVAR